MSSVLTLNICDALRDLVLKDVKITHGVVILLAGAGLLKTFSDISLANFEHANAN